MATRKETVMVCDVCGTRISDEGETYYGGHPHQGWYKLHEIGGSTQLKELNQQKDWDLCSKKCLMNLLNSEEKIDAIIKIENEQK